MYNEELYQRLINRFGVNTIKLFAIIEAYKYEILSGECKDGCNELAFEKEWWSSKAASNKTAILKS